MPVQPKVERIRDAARAVLDRLERGDALSAVLPQAKAVADEHGSRSPSFWIRCEMYGPLGIPAKKLPLDDQHDRAGWDLFGELHTVAGSWRLTLEEAERQATEEGPPTRDMIAYQSIAEVERIVQTWPRMQRLIDDGLVDAELALRHAVSRDERERVLWRVRDHLHEVISDIYRWAVSECENQALLGVDHRIVIDSLDALKTGVGQELAAAVEALSGANPALWAGSALICRNVILALGRSLWLRTDESYQSQLAGRTLDMKGEKEVNRLSAYVDHHHRVAKDGDTKRRLAELDELARSIYERGSKGKRRVRHEEARKLVVDAFELVQELDQLTGLEPVE